MKQFYRYAHILENKLYIFLFHTVHTKLINVNINDSTITDKIRSKKKKKR